MAWRGVDEPTLVSESDLQFVREKLKLVTNNAQPEAVEGLEGFKLTQECFGEVIERLPASGLLLSQIKREYEKVMATLTACGEETTALSQRLNIKQTEMGTMRNYHLRQQELEAKLAIIEADNKRVNNEIERMKKERERALRERESMQEQVKQSKPRMTSRRRRALQLSIEEAVNISQLQRELQKARMELQEMEEVMKKKYVSAQRKQILQSQLKEKEEKGNQLAAQNHTLLALLRKLKKASETAKAYSSAIRQGQVDPNQTSMVDYIISTSDFRVEGGGDSSDEEPNDPQKEKEAVMILDSFEKFNELFESEHYEEAALVVATSPKGILRSLDTMKKFQGSAKHRAGLKLPLLVYCEAIMQTAAAYRAVSLQEAMQCTNCALEQGEVPMLMHWVAQGSLPVSIEVGTLIFQHCKCHHSRCKELAFTVFMKCGAKQQAALCLVHQRRFLSFLALIHKLALSAEDCAAMLHTLPSLELARCLVMPPDPHSPKLTIIEAIGVFLGTNMASLTADLLQGYLKHNGCTCTQLVMNDAQTTWETWQSLITRFQQAGLWELALEFLSLLTTKLSLSHAMQNLEWEMERETKTERHGETQQTPALSTGGVSEVESSHLQTDTSGSFSGSGYTSSSEDDSPEETSHSGSDSDVF